MFSNKTIFYINVFLCIIPLSTAPNRGGENSGIHYMDSCKWKVSEYLKEYMMVNICTFLELQQTLSDITYYYELKHGAADLLLNIFTASIFRLSIHAANFISTSI